MTNQTITKTRDSFIFYRSFYQSAKNLPKKDKAEIFDAICNYALDGTETDMGIISSSIFAVIKPNLDANRRKWQNGCKDKKKDEAKQKQKISKAEAKDKQSRSKTEGNVNVNVDKDVECKSESECKIYDVNDELAEGLKFILEAKLNRSIGTSGWKDEIRKLIEIDLKPRSNALADVKRAIQAIADHTGKPYFPVVQSADSLRAKFDKIENFLKNLKPSQTNNATDIFENLMGEYDNE